MCTVTPRSRAVGWGRGGWFKPWHCPPGAPSRAEPGRHLKPVLVWVTRQKPSAQITDGETGARQQQDFPQSQDLALSSPCSRGLAPILRL